MMKQSVFKITGMNKDLGESSFSPEFAFENMNIRLMTNDGNTLLNAVNEKGNSEVIIRNNDGSVFNITGIPIGYAVIDNNIILFTTVVDTNIDGDKSSDYKDYIYKITKNNNTNSFNGSILYNGNLNFNVKYPIETLPMYENSELSKVYWTDGLNQPRVIIINNPNPKWDNTSFDFIRDLKNNEIVSIRSEYTASGMFSSGVIQYVMTYFTKNGQETNIFYTSPLLNITNNDRGGRPDEVINTAFNISITNADTRFDYIRLYSIHRTTLDTAPQCKVVTDIKIIDSAPLLFIDDGTVGSAIDNTILLYIGGEPVSVDTMTFKDNTLFVGGIHKKKYPISDTIIKELRENSIASSENIFYKPLPSPSSFYVYNNSNSDNSYNNKIFKYGETYRLGIQFLHKSGKWSEPIFLGDKEMDKHITYDNNNNEISSQSIVGNKFVYSISPNTVNSLISNGFIASRPVIVYPEYNDRTCICQGVLCPTVYNIVDRFNNMPFVQSSWFTRPNAPFDVNKTFLSGNTYPWNKSLSYTSSGNTYQTVAGDWSSFANKSLPSQFSRAGVMALDNNTIATAESGSTATSTKNIDTINMGAWAEFRHNTQLPTCLHRNCEIQSDDKSLDSIIFSNDKYPNDHDVITAINSYTQKYCIDTSIVTMHSPDIEFDDALRHIDGSNLKLRIVGIVPLTSFISDVDIQVSTPQITFYGNNNISKQALGLYKEHITASNLFGDEGTSHFGWRGLISAPLWFDFIKTEQNKDSKEDISTGNDGILECGYVIYPWHRNGSLNNTKYAENGTKSAMLDKKMMSNLRFSYRTLMLDKNEFWNASNTDNNHNGISDVQVFDSDHVELLRLKSPENSGLENINYYGNIDKVITYNKVGAAGYPINVTDIGLYNLFEQKPRKPSYHDSFIDRYGQIVHKASSLANAQSGKMSEYDSTDPIRMRYKSTPHAVIVLNYTSDKCQLVLPTIYDNDVSDNNNGGNNQGSGTVDPGNSDSVNIPWKVNDATKHFDNSFYYFDKGRNIKGVYQDCLNVDKYGDSSTIKGLQYGWLWLGELYNDNVQNRFGGTTEQAIANNKWLPCGSTVKLTSNKDCTINYTDGDTYYQRYDHLKTYPYSFEDQNQITDIISFMCETRVNIDGRYDRNRGNNSNLTISPQNFNLMNKVYSQKNNFFSYRGINKDKDNVLDFNNTIAWSKTKSNGEFIDTWPNITLASTLDLDADKGSITSLKRYNNDIIAFQDTGISTILYNDNMQITTTAGVPIEIANSGKVSGKRYISTSVGCSNKWSICDAPLGIYFIDDMSKDIYRINNNIDNLSDRCGMRSWIKQNSVSKFKWNPYNFYNFVTHYDKSTGDILFTNKYYCLAFSEPLDKFTSFYSYNNIPYIINMNDISIAFNITESNNCKMWMQHTGNYNTFFGKYKPFYTTIIANQDPLLCKIFDNVEFYTESWDSKGNVKGTTFDHIDVWNEYQNGSTDLTPNNTRPSNIKKKFRMWRAYIPRENGTIKRMVNPWLYIKLSKNLENTDKTILHNITVKYTV